MRWWRWFGVAGGELVHPSPLGWCLCLLFQSCILRLSKVISVWVILFLFLQLWKQDIHFKTAWFWLYNLVLLDDEKSMKFLWLSSHYARCYTGRRLCWLTFLGASNFLAFGDPQRVKYIQMFPADFAYLSIYEYNILPKVAPMTAYFLLQNPILL